MFELTSENLFDSVCDFRKYFRKSTNAKEHAEKECGKKIKWTRTRNGWCSPDLGYVMYRIKHIDTED